MAVLVLFPMHFLKSFAYAGVATVGFAAAAAVVVAPAPPLAFRKVRTRALLALRCARLNVAENRVKASTRASRLEA